MISLLSMISKIVVPSLEYNIETINNMNIELAVKKTAEFPKKLNSSSNNKATI